jgi:ribosomal protein S18 acetylase RimI-like enzyme
MPIEIVITTPFDTSIIPLIEDLSANLGSRFGNDGKNSFQQWDEKDSRFIFVKAIKNHEVIGCGAIRPITEEIAELKRMYSKYKRMGIGSAILSFLENKAKDEGYTNIWLETRKKNSEACDFYKRNDYQTIENYGKYINNEEAVCFGKKLIP